MRIEEDIKVLALLRQDSRQRLVDISKRTGIPVSTVFARLRLYLGSYVRRYTCLLNYDRLGYSIRVAMLLKVKPQNRQGLAGFLAKKPNVNSLYRVNNGYDFMVEAVFRDLNEVEGFLEEAEAGFGAKNQMHYLLENLKEQEFLADSIA